jgi:hypothetical protein
MVSKQSAFPERVRPDLPRKNDQQGTALIGVLMFLLVLTLLGSKAFRSTTADLQIGSGYGQGLQALYAAEAGLQQMLSRYRQNPALFQEKRTAAEMNLPTGEPTVSNFQNNSYWVADLRYDPQATPGFAEVIIQGKTAASRASARIRATLYSSTGAAQDVDPIFKLGIAAGGECRLRGDLSIEANLHANRGYVIDPVSLVADLRARDYRVTQSLDAARDDFISPLDIPRLSPETVQSLRTRAQSGNNRYWSGSQSLILSGDQQNALLFVEGDLLLEAREVRGVTVVATGALTLKGSSSVGDNQEIGVAFMAGRDIHLQEISDLQAVLWANGNIRQEGAGLLSGALVCQGSVLGQENFRFRLQDRVANPFLPRRTPDWDIRVGGWSQL